MQVFQEIAPETNRIFEDALLWTPYIHDHDKVESGETPCFKCSQLATKFCKKCNGFHCYMCSLSDCKFVSEELLQC